MEETGLIHVIPGLLACVDPGPMGTVASFVDAGIYFFVDHDYGMRILALLSSATMGAGCVVGAAKTAKIARTAEYVRVAGTLVSITLTFARSAINLEACIYNLYQKYKAGELGWDWETVAEVGAAVFSAAACVISGKNMMTEAKTLGKMMKEGQCSRTAEGICREVWKRF